MTPDFKELLNIFNENGVRYLIVGAYAVMKYTEPRFTKDLDIWIDSSPENAMRVFRSLGAFGAPLQGLTPEDFSTSGFYQMGRPPIRIDILMEVEGITFADAWLNKVPGDFDGAFVFYIDKTDLIKNKSIAGRPQDLIDIAALKKTAKGKDEV
jgi:hypothetical protein